MAAQSAIRQQYLSLEEAATYLGMSIRTVRRRIADGSIPASRVRNSTTIRVRVEDLDNLLQPIPTTRPSAS